MNLLVTGGCGYKGTVLIPLLLGDGHSVTSIDTQWFGNALQEHPQLTNLKLDVRETDQIPLNGVDAVIHLANIANDPAVELNPTLSWEVNVLAGQQLADRAVRAGVKQFLFASSGSVYGVKDEPKVTEDLTLVPISVYNKTKMVGERVFLSYADQMQVHCIRPATVCGLSPRMRLDVSVNMLTYQGLKNGKITVFGGEQTRPNIHIQDLANVYRHFLGHPEITSGCYNAGFENIKIREIAERVQQQTGAEIVITESNDPRSYRQDSSKLLATGFKPKFSVQDAIKQITEAYRNDALPDGENCYTVKWMRHLQLQAIS
ncbi:SDR family oxidoreductase [Synechococcus sp. A15-24]|uniref:NAD-dependent epimerase/dehydratase family protein n=1 Tax=Synechococcus sp. A15-24 TaxID=1050635 RepID=UPI001644038F|nr:SDR family oxidoreductase [Synechococcus sp. A15-24]QNJ27834.1 polysaccharide biosynthesis family protein [Synechococcus sp. A15-24]